MICLHLYPMCYSYDTNVWAIAPLYPIAPLYLLISREKGKHRLRVYTSVCRNRILCRIFWQEILACFSCRNFVPKYFVPKFLAKIFGMVPKFWLRILAQNFGTKFRAETFGKFFPCQNYEPKFWHRAKTFGTKWYFGTQMNRPRVSYLAWYLPVLTLR